MPGIYIHIPFCKRKCHYCNFFSVASEKLKKGFMDALFREIEQRKDYLGDKKVGSIYFGGGTPSVLSPVEIYNAVFTIYKFYDVAEDVEITIEVNPDDVDKEWVNELGRTQVNRVSIGVQSFHDADLVYLNRLHDAQKAIDAVELLKAAGYENISIDLIYGIPTLGDRQWRRNLERFVELDLPHLSAYALTVEPRTPLHQLIEKKKMLPVDEQQVVTQFRILQEITSQQGYIHYEISNFSREGFYSKHNSIYWLGGHYLGIGPSAHSYNGHSRQWNESSITRYINDQNARKETVEIEYLTEQQRYNEYVMTALRTAWGCDLEHIENVFGKDYREYCFSQATPFLDEGKLERVGNKLFLTMQGKIYADGIAAAMFWA
jgi:oxygen-independent coproporphyrinogen-3 oxidase